MGSDSDYPTKPIRLGVGPIIRTKHNSMALILHTAETEGFEACEHIGQQVPSGGWAVDLAQLGPRVCAEPDAEPNQCVFCLS